MSEIIARIERAAGVPGLVDILAERLAPTDLQSLLLEVYRRRADRLEPADILASYASNRFARPAAVAPEELLRWEQTAWAQLTPEFEVLELAPVCPLGTSSVVGGVDQNWALATARNTEVVSDSTNVLALECALRRRAYLRTDPKSAAPVHLAASHRLLRTQQFTGPDQVSHFRLLGLCSAGRDRGGLRFELETLGLHIRFYLRALRAYLGASAPLHVYVTDLQGQARHRTLDTRLLTPLRAEFENVQVARDDQRTRGHSYYRQFCFMIHATTRSGRRVELADGGLVDWAQQYLSNAKERLVTSGLGSERLCLVFASDRVA